MTAPGEHRIPEAEDLEAVCCALCGADDAERVLDGGDLRRRIPGRFQVVRCRRCGLAYVSPRPTQAAIARYYPTDYQPHRDEGSSAFEGLYYRWFRSPGAPDGARILDVGCGGGRYLRFLRSSGYEAVGVEPHPGVASRLRSEGLEVHPGTLPEADLPEASFDVVTLWWVLEHTHDPLRTLRAAHRALRPGGEIIVSVQNFASIGRAIFGAHWHHLDLPGHLYQFEPRTLWSLLERAGFEPTSLRHDLLAKDLVPSLAHRLNLRSGFDGSVALLLGLPLDLLGWALRRSGLITIRARRAA